MDIEIALLNTEERLIIREYVHYMSPQFWAAFKYYHLPNPYDPKTIEAKAWDKGVEAALRIQRRRGNCPSCS
jgi:hypothetical protein